MREAHLLASTTLALLLVFFAATGFVAHHRGWFHDGVDRTWPVEGPGVIVTSGPLPHPAPTSDLELVRAIAGPLGGSVGDDAVKVEGGRLRASIDDVWSTRGLEVDRASGRWTLAERRVPLAESLISLHRGRGRSEVLLDVVAALAIVAAASGAWLGLAGRGGRRRLVLALLVLSAAVLTALLAGG